jgi:mannonate dehydratase
MPGQSNNHGGPRRRDLLKLPFAAGLSSSAGAAGKVINEFDPANIKLSHRVSIRVPDDDLLFLKQIGLRYFRAEIPLDASLDEMTRARDRFARYGLSMYHCAHYAHQSPNILLGRPGPEREKDLDTCKTVLRHLGKLGVSVAVLDWLPANTFTTAMVDRHGYQTREFSLADFRSKVEKQKFEREYSSAEIWDAFAYYLKVMLPVAEEANVKLAMHPSDPPVIEKMNGVGRIFRTYEDYRRAEQLAGASKHWGVRLCVGTWSEGGDRMGKSVIEMIRDFGARGKLFDIDFRNVTSPLPTFQETLPDEGYVDMYQVMKALREVRYGGPMVPDHVPAMAGDQGMNRGGTSYCISYMRALLRRANEEVG